VDSEEEVVIPTYAHTQVKASRARVDEELAPLLEALWKQGYNTQWSCAGGLEPGSYTQQGGLAMPTIFGGNPISDAHLMFTTFQDGAAFLRNSCERMGWPEDENDILWSEFMVLEAACPYPRKSIVVRSNVIWAHHLTKKLIEVWTS
jgi:hypothetical protein